MQRRTCPGSLTATHYLPKDNGFPTPGTSENKGWDAKSKDGTGKVKRWDRESHKIGQGKSKDGTGKVKRWDKESQKMGQEKSKDGTGKVKR